MRITLLQTDILWEQPAANRRAIEAQLLPLAGSTDLIVLPEMFATGFSMDAQRLAESAGGETAQWLLRLAARLDAVVTGSVITRDGERCLNRLLWARPDGELEHYDKRHLFRMGGEDQHYAAGTAAPVFTWRGLRIAPQICYDLRFPVWSRRRSDHDYDLLLYVACWPAVRRHAWRSLLVARAIENQCFVAGVNRVGLDGPGMAHAGDSVVHDFLGQPLLELGDAPALASTVLDVAALTAFRARFPAQLDADRFTLSP